MALVELGKRLLEAARSGDVDEIHSLMSNGAPFTTDWLGMSPLHFAAACGHLQAAQMLLRAGISKDAKTKVDRTPLHVAAQFGHGDVVQLLLKSGGCVDSRDILHMTPLHWAVENQHTAVVQLLVRSSADVNCTDKFNRTPMDIALSHMHDDIVQLLQQSMTGEAVASLADDAVSGVIVEECITDTVESEECAATILPVTYDTQQPSLMALAAKHSAAAVTPVSAVSHLQSGIVQQPPGGLTPCSQSVLISLAELAEAATSPLVRNPPSLMTGLVHTAVVTTAATTAAGLHGGNGESVLSENGNHSDVETLSWFESQGMTIVSPTAGPSLVESSLESGQTLTLTEAGKLALKSLVKIQEAVERKSRSGCAASVDGSSGLLSTDYESNSGILSQDIAVTHTIKSHVR